MLYLLIQEKDGPQRELDLDKDEISIGRVPINEISLPKNNVSKRHAKIIKKGNSWELIDLKSTNGTYVNGQRVQNHKIDFDDQVIIGDFLLTFERMKAQQAAPPAPAPPPPSMPFSSPSTGGFGAPPPTAPPPPGFGAARPASPPPPASPPGFNAPPPAAPPGFSSPRSNAFSSPPPSSPPPGFGAPPPGFSPPPAPPTSAPPPGFGAPPPGFSPPPPAPAPAPPAPTMAPPPPPPTSAPPAFGRPPTAPPPSPSFGGMTPHPPAPTPNMAIPAAQDEGHPTPPVPSTPSMEEDLALSMLDEDSSMELNIDDADEISISEEFVEEVLEEDEALSMLDEQPSMEDLGAVSLEDAAPTPAPASMPTPAPTPAPPMPAAAPQPVAAQRELIVDRSRESVGWGPLDVLLEDESVTSVIVNGHEQIYQESNGQLTLSDHAFSSEEALDETLDRVLQSHGVQLQDVQGCLELRLDDGSWLHVARSPLSRYGTSVILQPQRGNRLLADNLVGSTLSPEMNQFLESCVQHRRNILISGDPGSGRTTLLNVLADYIPNHERIISVEEIGTLELVQPHWISLETLADSPDGSHGISMPELVAQAVRMRPQRLLVDNIDGDSLEDLVSRMLTGLSGSIVTTGSSSPQRLLRKLEALLVFHSGHTNQQGVRQQLSESFDVIVQINQFPCGTRKVTSIHEVNGLDHEGNVELRTLFTFNPNGASLNGQVNGQFSATGTTPLFYEELQTLGANLSYDIFS